MGVHSSDQATLHPMVSKDYELFTIAVSSKGHYPAAAKALAKKAGDYIQAQEAERLLVLSRLRKFITTKCERSLRHSISRQLVSLPLASLLRFETILTCEKVRVLCYHGVKNTEVLQELEAFDKLVKQQQIHEGVEHVFLSKPVCDVWSNKAMHIWYIEDFLACLSAFPQVKIQLVPMLFQQGHYYDRLLTYAQTYGCSIQPVWNLNEDIPELLARIKQQYFDIDAIVIRYHSTRIDNPMAILPFQTNPNVYFSFEKEAPPKLPPDTKRLLIVFLYMLEGMHMQADMNMHGVLAAYYEQQGITWTYTSGSAIASSLIQPLLLKKVLR